ncbi:hypothetical protein ACJX0J_020426, partial [Zea mays]
MNKDSGAAWSGPHTGTSLLSHGAFCGKFTFMFRNFKFYNQIKACVLGIYGFSFKKKILV